MYTKSSKKGERQHGPCSIRQGTSFMKNDMLPFLYIFFSISDYLYSLGIHELNDKRITEASFLLIHIALLLFSPFLVI